MYIFLILKAVLYGITEAVTEWLPISSTGHLILLQEFLPLGYSGEFAEAFDFVIQLGAILAVMIIYRNRLLPRKHCFRKWFLLWSKVALASVPAAVVGVVLDKLLLRLTGCDIDSLFFNPLTVAAALIAYGIAFIAVEKLNKGKLIRVDTIDGISYTDAFRIGCFQALSVIPGTSRSGSTVLGGMLTGVSRVAAAEFSFLMAVPVMLGGSAVKLLELNLSQVSSEAWVFLTVSFVTAFAVSLAVVGFLTGFLKKHSFTGFGIYRILLGIVVLIYFLCKVG